MTSLFQRAFISAALLLFLSVGFSPAYAQGNLLLDREFWDARPTAAEVAAAIDASADPRAVTRHGVTPLHLAAFEGGPETIRLLLDNGGSVSARDALIGDTVLHIAAAHNRAPQVTALLLQRGADIHARGKYGDTPLHDAARLGAPAVVELLLRHGGKINARDTRQETPLHEAAWSNTPEVVALLLRHGADAQSLDRHGKTPLDWARQRVDMRADMHNHARQVVELLRR